MYIEKPLKLSAYPYKKMHLFLVAVFVPVFHSSWNNPGQSGVQGADPPGYEVVSARPVTVSHRCLNDRNHNSCDDEYCLHHTATINRRPAGKADYDERKKKDDPHGVGCSNTNHCLPCNRICFSMGMIKSLQSGCDIT
jgi:hypothetical protein